VAVGEPEAIPQPQPDNQQRALTQRAAVNKTEALAASFPE